MKKKNGRPPRARVRREKPANNAPIQKKSIFGPREIHGTNKTERSHRRRKRRSISPANERSFGGKKQGTFLSIGNEESETDRSAEGGGRADEKKRDEEGAEPLGGNAQGRGRRKKEEDKFNPLLKEGRRCLGL